MINSLIIIITIEKKFDTFLVGYFLYKNISLYNDKNILINILYNIF